MEHERKHRIINIEKSGNKILYFYVIEKVQKYMKGSDAEATFYWVFKKDFTEEMKFKGIYSSEIQGFSKTAFTVTEPRGQREEL